MLNYETRLLIHSIAINAYHRAYWANNDQFREKSHNHRQELDKLESTRKKTNARKRERRAKDRIVREKEQAQRRAWHIANPTYYIDHRDVALENAKRSRFNHMYGITIDDYSAMLDKQGGKCAICGKHYTELKKSLCVDHDHKTGSVRGLLCHYCNTFLGMMGDDPDKIRLAAQYLEANK